MEHKEKKSPMKNLMALVGGGTAVLAFVAFAAFSFLKPHQAQASESPPSAPAPMTVTEVARELPAGTAVFETTNKDGERKCDIYVDKPDAGVIEQVKQTASKAACEIKSFLFNSDEEQQAEVIEPVSDTISTSPETAS